MYSPNPVPLPGIRAAEWPLHDLLFGTGPIAQVQDFFGRQHPLPFQALSLLGDTWGVILVMGLAFWLFGRDVLHALIGIVVAGAATKVVLTSFIFRQSRPHGPGIIVFERLDVGSFPSGHVYEAVGPWGLLHILGCIPLWVPVLISLLVGLSRVYLGTHYVGDVLGGIFFGVLLLWAFARSWPVVRTWLERRRARFYAVGGALLLAASVGWIFAIGDHPRWYEIVGIVLGGTMGLFLEHRYVGYSPVGRSGRARVLLAALGTGGIVTLLLLDRSAGEDRLLFGIITAGLATVWALLGVPWAAGRLSMISPPR